MKKFALLIFAITITFQAAYAQFGVGVSAGLNNSTVEIKGDTEISPDPTYHYFIGLSPNYAINDKFSVNMDLQYSGKGFIFSFDTGDELTMETKLRYLDFIPEVQYHIFPGLSLGIGVNYGLLLEEKSKFGDQEWMTDDQVTNTKSTDLGLTGTLRGNYKNFFAFLRYNHGIKNISNAPFTDQNGLPINQKQYNRNIQLGVGYNFTI